MSVTNVFTAIFAGFAVFSVLGFMAYNLEASVADVVQGGPGLAFIAYPEAVLMMPLPHLWALCFFFMMFILGMGSQFGGIEAMCTAVIDQWPHLRDHHWKVCEETLKHLTKFCLRLNRRCSFVPAQPQNLRKLKTLTIQTKTLFPLLHFLQCNYLQEPILG